MRNPPGAIPSLERLTVPPELLRGSARARAAGQEATGERIVRTVTERIGRRDLAGLDILDVGCGVRFPLAIVNRNIVIGTYTGIESSKAHVDYLNSALAAHDARFRFHHWDVAHPSYNPTGAPMRERPMPPAGESFDVLWLFSVFTHLTPDDSAAMLRELRTHVRRGGILYFTAFIDDSMAGFEPRDPIHPLRLAFYGRSLMEKLIADAGWSVGAYFPRDDENYMQAQFLCRPE